MNPIILEELTCIRRQTLDEELKNSYLHLYNQAHHSEKINLIRGEYKKVSKDGLQEEEWKRDE